MTLLQDVDAVFCSRLGLGPWERLEAAGIQPVVDYAWQPVREALSSWFSQQPKVAKPVARKGVSYNFV